MFNKNIKLILAAAAIGYAVYQFIEGFIGNGIFLCFLSFISFSSTLEMRSYSFLFCECENKIWMARNAG